MSYYGFNPDVQSPVPVCPRHPERISHVRCQRCGRPACPECQRSAPVGIQCVDCVAEGQSQVRQATTIFGGKIAGPTPVVTYTLMALCVLSYVLQLSMGWSGWTSRLAFAPFLGEDEPWRFVTAAFVHAQQVTHILFNMYALYIVGPVLEQALGRARFICLYLLSAVGGSVCVLLLANPMSMDWFTAHVGASGAIFGLFGALFVVLKRVNMPANQILVLIAINTVIGFVVPNISWEGHLGGLVVGVLMALAYAKAPRIRQQTVAWTLPLLTAVALVAIAWGVYEFRAPAFG